MSMLKSSSSVNVDVQSFVCNVLPTNCALWMRALDLFPPPVSAPSARLSTPLFGVLGVGDTDLDTEIEPVLPFSVCLDGFAFVALFGTPGFSFGGGDAVEDGTNDELLSLLINTRSSSRCTTFFSVPFTDKRRFNGLVPVESVLAPLSEDLPELDIVEVFLVS